MGEINKWLNIKETVVSKEEFCEKMDEILEKVSAEKSVYVITEKGEKKYAVCPIDMFDIFKSDNFSCVVNSAVRYALGRNTYMPSVIKEFVLENITALSTKTLENMRRDIEEHAKDYPEMYQKALWETLLKEVVLELEKRNKK